jgi:hypothetical protein
MEPINRRRFLQFLPAAAAIAAIPALAACKKDLSCADESALTEDQKTTRKGVQYVDATMTPGKPCSGCKWFKSAGAEACGSCEKVPGPIHPNGGCLAFVAAGS